jgi:hypothetical protein
VFETLDFEGSSRQYSMIAEGLQANEVAPLHASGDVTITTKGRQLAIRGEHFAAPLVVSAFDVTGRLTSRWIISEDLPIYLRLPDQDHGVRYVTVYDGHKPLGSVALLIP